MSILQREIPGAKVLDLFSGSGALGLEALSRGAVSVDFVENSAGSLRSLRANIEKLGAEADSTIHRADAIKFAGRLAAGDFDIAFADPPYSGGAAVQLAAHWLQVPFSSIFSVEHGAFEKMPAGGDTRRYGTSAITIYRGGE